MAFDFTLYNPETWEMFCDRCYSIAYGQEANWHKVPSKYKGDCGIEGYLKGGEIVYQCYYPSDDISSAYYAKLRSKMHTDLEKLKNNKDRLIAIGVEAKIKEWHFVIPENKDKQILEYRTTKQKEIRSLNLDYIDPKFKIIIKTYDSFESYKLKANILLGTKLQEKSFINKNHKKIDYFSLTNNEKVENVKRKCLILNDNFNKEEYFATYKEMVNIFMDYYVKGITIFENMKKEETMVYEAIDERASSYKDDAIVKANLNAGKISRVILDEITGDFEDQLRKTFKDIIDDMFIAKISKYIVASWIADCSLNFVN